MRQLLITMLIFLVGTKANASKIDSPPLDARDLQIKWEAVQDDYQNKAQSLNAITITNTGKNTLPSSGWKLYFNSPHDFLPTSPTGNVKVEHINGDLFSFTPLNTFTELKPGGSVRIEFIDTDNIVNFTDAPEGFYVVWDAQTDKGYSVGGVNIAPFKPTYKGLITPEIIYNQNASITDIPEKQLTKVFPSPTSYSEIKGVFKLNSGVQIVNDSRFEKEAEVLTDKFRTMLEGGSAASENTIKLVYKEGMNPQGYAMEVKPKAIFIVASTPTGIFYGIQSLLSLISPSAYVKPQSEIKIQCVEIQDAPRFGYRAFMLDVGRNFQTKKQVERLLDLLALYKINTFHFHLTEDEGWRLEIPSLPELTEIGSQRGHSLDSKKFLPACHGSGPETGKLAGSGFYTKADYVEILKYANERHITVITEIETPGHARAAIKAMNARYTKLMAQGKKAEAEKYLLYDLNDKSEYSSNQFWNDNIMDVSLPSTYNFIGTVINDIVAMYKEAGAPLKMIHFGGDEVPAHVWEKSPAYVALQGSHPEIQNTGDLWYYFYGKVNQMLKAKGLNLAGWEEMALRKTKLDGRPVYVPNPDFMPEHLQTEVWNNTLGDGNEDLAYRLANSGYKVVLSCVTNLYFDMANYKSFDEPGYYWGAFSDIDKPFSFIPFDYFKNTKVDKNGLPINRNIFIGKQRLTDYGKSNIVGLQCALWGETVKTTEREEYMLLPRLLGFAERAWSQDPEWATTNDTTKSQELYAQAWSNFLNVLGKRELPRLDYLNGGYGYRIPKPGVIEQNGKLIANEQFPGLTIRYTTNGKDPDAKSSVYNDGVTIENSLIKFRTFNNKGRGSNVTEIAK
ncbi:family 20 glycosylhydrolase [Mucilaginibacter sp. BT774]|uniref:family 20 glycosylhydrolase n=1 Tax=Mucilaginibacter sp. BT774 TaxID=3062276 RepID=UPI0026750A11|nr:family 20 glycosylhydrolase [Mucilaginibacter sp. BT774]MDO3628661.1 family 20 glycosylhydrolase [Mucilaginibacter sp. BT774]